MNLSRVDHTAIVVSDLDGALERYFDLFQISPSVRTAVHDQGVEVAFLPLGDTYLEFLCPIDATGGVARFLARRGEGLHHVGIAVDDLNEELRRLAANGTQLLDHTARRGVHGWIAFIHPKSTGGTLIELVMNDAGHSRG